MTIGGWVITAVLGIVAFVVAWVLTDVSKAKYKIMAFLIASVFTLGIGFVFHWYFTGTERGKRALKTQQSDLNNGIERTVAVYDYSGSVIKSWSGKFDVTESENEVYFDDADGRRVIIHGGIVINEEK